jgi:hypothetical protein
LCPGAVPAHRTFAGQANLGGEGYGVGKRRFKMRFPEKFQCRYGVRSALEGPYADWAIDFEYPVLILNTIC